MWGAVVGTGMDIATSMLKQGIQSEHMAEQRRQQLEADKKMADYNYKLSMQKFKDTGYEAQAKQMRDAGLSVGLMYGGSGGGGQTAQLSGSGTSAPQQMNMDSGMGIAALQAQTQNEVLKAQAENLKADTKKKEAEASKTVGVDTDLGNKQIESLTQGIENAKAQEELTKIESQLIDIRVRKENETYYSWLDRFENETSKIKAEAKSAMAESKVNQATINEKIGIIKQELINSGLQNILTEANINLTNERVKEIGVKLEQAWKQLEIQGKANDINAKRQVVDEILGQDNLQVQKDSSVVRKVFEIFRTIGHQFN